MEQTFLGVYGDEVEEKALIEYAQKAVIPRFVKRGARRVKSNELKKGSYNARTPLFRHLVRFGLIRQHRIEGNDQSVAYIVYDLSKELAEKCGIDATKLDERNDILPKNMLKKVKAVAKQKEYFSSKDMQAALDLTPVQVSAFLKHIGPLYKLREGKNFTYSLKPFKIPEEVKEFCGKFPNISKTALTKLLEGERGKEENMVDYVARTIGLSDQNSKLKYVGALSSLLEIKNKL